MKVQNLMVNHIATVQPINPPNIAIPKYSDKKIGEYWAYNNKTP